MATEKEQRGCHRLPGSDPGRRRGRTHSSRASPEVRLRSWLARPRPGVRAGRGFPQAPSPSAEPLGTCRTNLVRGGAKECLSAQKVRAVESAPWRRTPGPGSRLSCLGHPLAYRGKEVSCGAGSRWRESFLGDTRVGGRKRGGRGGGSGRRRAG